ncbi:hypothetical protein [Streptomyces nigrescens]|uniref:hypothetical protein n=1 Tax=Streptomyces nigrescens TaxID=1920 RepID=UPI0036FA7081
MPELTLAQDQELQELLTSAARAEQRSVVPTLHRLIAIDPLTGRKLATALLLDLIRHEEGGRALRSAIDITCRLLTAATSPAGRVLAAGEAAGDPLMLLTRDVVQLHLQGEGAAAWAQLEPLPLARRAAVLSILAAWLHCDITGIDPSTL